MALSTIIFPTVFEQLTEEQVLTWRMDTYNNIGNSKKYKKKHMLSIKSSNSMSYDLIERSIKRKIHMYKAIGKLSSDDIIFVMVDACTLCKKELPTIIQELRCLYSRLTNINIILVVSNINLTENKSKIIKEKKSHNTSDTKKTNFINKYGNVDFNILQKNLDYLEGKINMENIGNVAILNTGIVFDNKVLYQEERLFLRNHNNMWDIKDRNQINDNAQLTILIHLYNMFSKECFMITRDNDLLERTREIGEYINIKALNL